VVARAPPDPWPPEVLQVLSQMWRTNKPMPAIRRTLAEMLGFNPGPELVRHHLPAAAASHQRKLGPVGLSAKRSKPPAVATNQQPKPKPFSMLGGTLGLPPKRH
jgi:hypothetical protein